MDFIREKNNRVAYVLATKQDSLNQRVEGVLLLKDYFDKLVQAPAMLFRQLVTGVLN